MAFRFYLDGLAAHAGKTGCQIHAYVLMTNHVHLLLSAETAQAVGALNLALQKNPGQGHISWRKHAELTSNPNGC